MLRATKVTYQSPPPPVSEPVENEKGEDFLLDDDLVVDVYNLSFDELQKNIVHAQRNYFLDYHASPAFTKERLRVLDVKNHLTSLA